MGVSRLCCGTCIPVRDCSRCRWVCLPRSARACSASRVGAPRCATLDIICGIAESVPWTPASAMFAARCSKFPVTWLILTSWCLTRRVPSHRRGRASRHRLRCVRPHQLGSRHRHTHRRRLSPGRYPRLRHLPDDTPRGDRGSANMDKLKEGCKVQ